MLEQPKNPGDRGRVPRRIQAIQHHKRAYSAGLRGRCQRIHRERQGKRRPPIGW